MVVPLWLPGWLKPRIEAAVNGMELDSLAVTVAPPSLVLHGARLRDGDPRDSAVFARAERVVVPLDWRSLFSDPWRFGVIHASGVSVTVHEGDAHFPRGDGQTSLLPPFLCEGIRVDDAAFNYRKDSRAGAAVLRLAQVTAKAEAFGNFGEWRARAAEAEARALLEKSGQVKLRVAAWLHENEPRVEVDLSIHGQKLASVNPYFEPEEGVTLRGLLLSSRALVKVRGWRAEGNVEANYAGLAIKFHKNRHRGGLDALLLNLGAALKLDQANTEESRLERLGAVVTTRHPRESIVSFILRTMREAALRVATN